ncbi:hypothetical protein KW783_02265 [Candidatus Parcubacteria bacterium]|nr:hypothetical protein [Candidatus Parcubacteria bacterium]
MSATQFNGERAQRPTIPKQPIDGPSNQSNESGHVTTAAGWTMLAVALAIDGLQFLLSFIPVVGWIIDIVVYFFAWILFYVWFKMYGVNFSSTRRILSLNGGFILDLIPFLDLFAWVGAVGIIVYSAKIKKIVNTIPGGTTAVNTVSSVNKFRRP